MAEKRNNDEEEKIKQLFQTTDRVQVQLTAKYTRQTLEKYQEAESSRGFFRKILFTIPLGLKWAAMAMAAAAAGYFALQALQPEPSVKPILVQKSPPAPLPQSPQGLPTQPSGQNQSAPVNASVANQHESRERAIPAKTVAGLYEGCEDQSAGSLAREPIFNEIMLDYGSPSQTPNCSNVNNQWIEIYNPSRDIVEIGGWRICVNTKCLSLPDGKIIQPDSFVVVYTDDSTITHQCPVALMSEVNQIKVSVPEKPWFPISAAEQSVVLYNKQGRVLDQIRYGGSRISDAEYSVAKGMLGTLSRKPDGRVGEDRWFGTGNQFSGSQTPGWRNCPKKRSD